jgi:protein-arginine kinase activator protein McsA
MTKEEKQKEVARQCKRILLLKKQLHICVQYERYIVAASIRDQIKEKQEVLIEFLNCEK